MTSTRTRASSATWGRARPELRDRLEATLDAWRQATGEAVAGGEDGADGPGDGTEQIPDDLRRQLESLGYVGGGRVCAVAAEW